MEGRLLLVEDDFNLQKVLMEQLRLRGWESVATASGKTALELVTSNPPDLVLLDIGLEDMDGLQVCRELRRHSNIPIVLVTAADTPEMKITALELGADDYLTKPFYFGELIARMKAVLRRTRAQSGPPPAREFQFGVLEISLEQREVKRTGTLVRLTKTEFDLLRELVCNPDQVLPYDHFLKALWGEGYDDVRALHVHMSNLRRKLEPDVTALRHVLTVPGVGYRFRSYTKEQEAAA